MPTPHQRPPLQLQAAIGEALLIELEAQPGAGLLWQAHPAPAGCRLADAGRQGDADDGLVGGPARQRFVFSAAAAGEHRLQFTLKRPWQDPAHALQTVVVQVR